MAEWIKAPEQVVETFYAALPDHPAVERRKMFGYPVAFAQGNMFTGVFQASIFVRLSDELREEFERDAGATPFMPMQGRPMKGYAVVPDVILADPSTLREWIQKSLDTALALPPKEKKPRAARKKKPA